MNVPRHLRTAALLLSFALIPAARPAHAYSLLTHEQLIDLTWRDSIVPLLKSRYPDLTPAQLEHARAFAYGGCVIQDIGYYPFGDPFFSDLTHYVRTGDFIVALFRDARNADELAFAVGALSHYIGDTIGHQTATNLAVPVEFPKLAQKFGPSVSYVEGKHQHVQTEFAFDINEIAHHRVAPVHYLRHVGLQVPTALLAKAFYETYGLGEDFSARRSRRVNVGGYRFAVRSFLPRIAYALNVLHRNHEPADIPGPERAELDREIDQVAKDSQWDQYRHKPGIGTYSLAGLLYILPKIGPLKLASIKGPTAATEELYAKSVLRSADALRATLSRFTPPPTRATSADVSAAAARARAASPNPPPPIDPAHPLANRDLDTGGVSKPGSYLLTDVTFANLVHRLAQAPTQPIPPTIKQTIQAYYADPAAPISTHKDPQKWAQLQADLAILKTIPVQTEPLPFPTYDDANPPENNSPSTR